jgi:hypothetical protein
MTRHLEACPPVQGFPRPGRFSWASFIARRFPVLGGETRGFTLTPKPRHFIFCPSTSQNLSVSVGYIRQPVAPQHVLDQPRSMHTGRKPLGRGLEFPGISISPFCPGAESTGGRDSSMIAYPLVVDFAGLTRARGYRKAGIGPAVWRRR